MALNWVMLAPSGKDLLPLPGEKTFLTVPSVEVTIKPIAANNNSKSSTSSKAAGKIHISNKRIAFVANNAAALPDPHNPNQLRTLTCPLNHFLDGRFVQPWLAANYYEAHIKPVANGGLSTAQDIRIDFKEGGGFDFTNTVEEVKSRFCEEQAIEAEALPTYSAAPTTSEQAEPSNAQQPGRAQRTNSMPCDEDIQAANTARSEETAEVENAETQQDNQSPPIYKP